MGLEFFAELGRRVSVAIGDQLATAHLFHLVEDKCKCILICSGPHSIRSVISVPHSIHSAINGPHSIHLIISDLHSIHSVISGCILQCMVTMLFPVWICTSFFGSCSLSLIENGSLVFKSLNDRSLSFSLIYGCKVLWKIIIIWLDDYFL